MEPLAQPPRRGRAAVFVAVPVALVMALLVFVLVTRRSAAERAVDFNPLIDRPAPAIVGKTLDGEDFDLDRLRGQWVVVNFFATWCLPCQAEHPDLLSFARRHEQVGDVQLVSVVFQDDEAAVRDYYEKNGGDWPVVVGDQGRLALDYSVIRPPDTYIIDQFGIVRDRIPRPVVNADELDQRISAIAQKLSGSTSS